MGWFGTQSGCERSVWGCNMSAFSSIKPAADACQLGMDQFAKEPHSQKAPFPMWVTESGMVKFTKDLQPAKAPPPMWVTESGIVKLAKEVQPLKA